MAVAWNAQNPSSPAFVRLLITSNVSSHSVEKRYRHDLPIGELKCKLELITGCDWRHVKLQLFTEEDEHVADLSDNSATLADYPIADGLILQCTDPTKSLGHYDVTDEDEAAASYQMSYEEYLKRPNTFLRWLKDNKLGRFRERTPEEIKAQEEARQRVVDAENELISKMSTGDRCEVKMTDKCITGQVRGTVKFMGETKLGSGKWVGVQLDEPFGQEGKNEYFDCQPKYGILVKPHNVAIGDYPELTPDDLDEL